MLCNVFRMMGRRRHWCWSCYRCWYQVWLRDARRLRRWEVWHVPRTSSRSSNSYQRPWRQPIILW